MFGEAPIFQLAMHLSRHATAEQAVASENIANADTPKYRARRLSTFQDMMDRTGYDAFRARNTRPGHLLGIRAELSEAAEEASPNGNSVALETEMLASVEAGRRHDRAMAIYRSHLTILRAAISRN